MTDEKVHGGLVGVPTPSQPSFLVVTGWVLMGNAVGSTVFVSIAGLALGLPVRKLIVLLLLLFSCGVPLAPLIYWVRLARERPRSLATRFTLAMLLHLTVLGLALGVGATAAGVLSRAQLVNDALPCMVPSVLMGSAIAYFVARNFRKISPSKERETEAKA